MWTRSRGNGAGDTCCFSLLRFAMVSYLRKVASNVRHYPCQRDFRSVTLRMTRAAFANTCGHVAAARVRATHAVLAICDLRALGLCEKWRPKCAPRRASEIFVGSR